MDEPPDRLDKLFPGYRTKEKFCIDGTAGLEGYIVAREHLVSSCAGERVRFNAEILFPPSERNSQVGVVHHMVLRIWGDSVKSRFTSRTLNMTCRMPEDRILLLLSIPSGDSTVYLPDVQIIADYARSHLKYPEVEVDMLVKILQEMMDQFAEVPD